MQTHWGRMKYNDIDTIGILKIALSTTFKCTSVSHRNHHGLDQKCVFNEDKKPQLKLNCRLTLRMQQPPMLFCRMSRFSLATFQGVTKAQHLHGANLRLQGSKSWFDIETRWISKEFTTEKEGIQQAEENWHKKSCWLFAIQNNCQIFYFTQE